MKVLRHVLPRLRARRGRGAGALAHDIVLVLALKVCILVFLWYAFVRGQAITVDARAAAAQFGMFEPAPSAPVHSQGASDGQ